MRKAMFILFLIYGGFSLPVSAGEPDLSLSQGTVTDNVVVVESKRELPLFMNGKIFKVYRNLLGKQPTGPQECEGDKKTPEGTYVNDYHKRDSNFHRALHVSSPARKDFERVERKGVSPGVENCTSMSTGPADALR